MLDLAKLDVVVDVKPTRKKTNAKPTQRTLAELRKLGYVAKVVEKWNMHARIRQDLWGADVLALGRDHVLAVQTTTGVNHQARKKKLLDSGFVKLWKRAGVRVEVWTWTKKGARGQRKLWVLRREAL